jgi:hypothetical protein
MVRAVKLVLLVNLLLQGCNNSRPLAPSFYVHVYYKNQNGDDLLNPNTVGHYDGVQVFDLVTKNGVLTSVSTPIDSCTNYICQSAKSGLYYVQFHPEQTYKGTVIHAGSNSDTLNYVTVPMNSTFGIGKVLYKGQIIWSAPQKFTTTVSVTIVK